MKCPCKEQWNILKGSTWMIVIRCWTYPCLWKLYFRLLPLLSIIITIDFQNPVKWRILHSVSSVTAILQSLKLVGRWASDDSCLENNFKSWNSLTRRLTTFFGSRVSPIHHFKWDMNKNWFLCYYSNISWLTKVLELHGMTRILHLKCELILRINFERILLL